MNDAIYNISHIMEGEISPESIPDDKYVYTEKDVKNIKKLQQSYERKYKPSIY